MTHLKLTSYFAFLLMLSACQIVPLKNPTAKSPWLQKNLLNSQRIELKYGSYGVDVLAQNDDMRLSNLYSLKDGQKITRTIAYILYQRPLDQKLALAHQQIISGGSIGSTLKAHGFQVKKDFFYLDEIVVPKALQSYLGKEKALAVIYDLKVDKGVELPYCTILEIYDGDFLTKAEALKLYPVQKPEDNAKVTTILNAFEQRVNEAI